MADLLGEKKKSILNRYSTKQDQKTVYRTYQKARRKNLRLKNSILIRNGFRPHLTSYPVDRLDLDLTNINLKEQVTTSLRLPDSELSSLPVQVFRDYPYLELLDVSNNYISVIDEELGVFLPNLQKLLLAGNNLTEIPIDLVEMMDNLALLDISSNPLDINWVKKLLAYTRLSKPRLSIIL